MSAPLHITDAELADWIAYLETKVPGERSRMTNGIALRGLRRIAADAPIVAAARALAKAEISETRGGDEFEDAMYALVAACEATP